MVWHYSHLQQTKQGVTLPKLTKVYVQYNHLLALLGLLLRAQFCSCVIHVLRQSESSIWLDNTKHIKRNTDVLPMFRGLCSIKRLSYGAMAVTNRPMNMSNPYFIVCPFNINPNKSMPIMGDS
jgi:hypothetical protein